MRVSALDQAPPLHIHADAALASCRSCSLFFSVSLVATPSKGRGLFQGFRDHLSDQPRPSLEYPRYHSSRISNSESDLTATGDRSRSSPSSKMTFSEAIMLPLCTSEILAYTLCYSNFVFSLSSFSYCSHHMC